MKKLQLTTRRRIHKSQGERHATWLELFFDLIAVVAVARLGFYLHTDHSLTGLVTFIGLFAVIWWIWISYSYFADIFDNDSIFDRLVQFAGMAGLALVALSLPGSQTADPLLFAAANIGLFMLLGVVYFISGRSEAKARELSHWYTAGSLSGALLWGVSLFIDAPGHYYLWGAAVLVNALLSGPIAYALMRHTPQQDSHMPERFGLFLIIVLGEVILATINGIAEVHLSSAGIVVGLAGFIIAASIWWLYFNHFDDRLITKAIQRGSGAQVRSFIYGYGHLLVYAAIVVLGVGFELAIEHNGTAEPLIGIGIAGIMCGFVLTSIGNGNAVHYILTFYKILIAATGILCATLTIPAIWSCLLLGLALLLLIPAEARLADDKKALRLN
ncbi:MAG TPA: low temperature requirement protein A [Candidatus Saccharimonadales bacterium]